MVRTPAKANHTQYTQIKTPSSKNRIIHFNSSRLTHASPNPNLDVARENHNNPLPDHPIEVIGRIRDLPASNKEKHPTGIGFQIIPDQQTIRLRTEVCYRDFSLDGVSSAEDEDLEGFYKKFIQSRILGVKLGAKCTIMMYGPTGSGKSHTMFGCSKQPGIVYKSLKDILGENGGVEAEGTEEQQGLDLFVQVTVMEIYNEEIYDLLSCEKSGSGFNLWSKGSASKVKLEVMGRKAKNATFISGNEAGKISREIQKVEKRRIVKSTNCNDRSSRSHCMIILDVPTVGGRLMLVDMAGSENIEQAGQIGLEAKMQTGRINQGNAALKRVVESIANGDSHVPFRDSKLTMLLQDSFEDDKSKILMILCASPDPKEMHKTISTLEYGAKAKCIVRGPRTPNKGGEDSSSGVVMGSRIAAMDQFIMKLQMENKQREKECSEAQKQLRKKEEEIAQLRQKLEQSSSEGICGTSEEEINEKVNERTEMLRQELERQVKESQRMAEVYVELDKRRMEEKILQQQQEMEMLRRKLAEMEMELSRSRDGSSSDGSGPELENVGLARRLKEIYSDDDPCMIKSMDLDMGDQEPYGKEVKIVGGSSVVGHYLGSDGSVVEQGGEFIPSVSDRMGLSTVYEEEEEIEEEDENGQQQGKSSEDEAVEKEVIDEKRVPRSTNLGNNSSPHGMGSYSSTTPQPLEESTKDTAASRMIRIQNIFTLCGNYRELPRAPMTNPALQNQEPEHQLATGENHGEGIFNSTPSKSQKEVSKPAMYSVTSNPISELKETTTGEEDSKENMKPGKNDDSLMDVYVKWEATKEDPGKFITKLNLAKDARLADLRKLIEIHLGVDKQEFTFLALGGPTGAPVSREEESNLPVTKLAACNNQLGGHLACLRPVKETSLQPSRQLPFASVENNLSVMTPISCVKQEKEEVSLGSTPFITSRNRGKTGKLVY